VHVHAGTTGSDIWSTSRLPPQLQGAVEGSMLRVYAQVYVSVDIVGICLRFLTASAMDECLDRIGCT
jgi:hypothetical protein